MQQDKIKYWLDGFGFSYLDEIACTLAYKLDDNTPEDETLILDSEFDFDSHQLYVGKSLDEARELTAKQKDELQRYYKKHIDFINKERSDYYVDYCPQKTIRGSNPDFD